MQITKSFVVKHRKNSQLGVGFVVGGGIIPITKDNGQIEGDLQLFVLWDNMRNPSPCIHRAVELEWIQTEEDYKKTISENVDLSTLVEFFSENADQPISKLGDVIEILADAYPDHFDEDEDDEDDEDEDEDEIQETI